MVETNRIVQDMEDLENDLNEKLIRSRSNSAANGRNTPDVHSRRGSSDGNFHRENNGIYKQTNFQSTGRTAKTQRILRIMGLQF